MSVPDRCAESARRAWLRRAGVVPLFRLAPQRVSQATRALLMGGLAAAAAPAQATGMAWGEQPKYPADYTAFDYVNPDAPRGGTLRLDGFGSFDKLNPFTLRGLPAAGLESLVFETLGEMGLDEPFAIYPLLARGFEFAPDATSITFDLDPRARFHDGAPLEADDVLHSFRSLTGARAHPRYAQWFADVGHVEVLDPQRIRFDFKRFNHELHLILATQLPIFSRRWGAGRPFDEVTTEVPLGTGPYRPVQWQWGQSISYRRHPEYWADALPVRTGMYRFERIEYLYFRDDTARLEGFRAGLFDWLQEMSARNWARGHRGRPYEEGRLVRRQFPHGNPSGMQGFALNLRQARFQDVRVREALALAFDFEWMNTHLFYGQYTRSGSYFNNSPMKASGRPAGEELRLLQELGVPVDRAILEEPVPEPDPPGLSRRERLLRGLELLRAAGWTVGADQVLRDAQGTAFTFEVLSYSPTLERVAVPWAHNLARYGIAVRLRTVDVALYQRRLDDFDFDVTTHLYPVSSTPGNELFEMFGSKAASQPTSSNVPGIADPVIDAVISRIVVARSREGLYIAVRALDRVLRHGWYLVPQYFLGVHRLVFTHTLRWPERLPVYGSAQQWLLKTWWIDPHAQPRPPQPGSERTLMPGGTN